MVANEVPTQEDIHPLHSALRDLSHRVTTTAPTARPTAPTARTAPPLRLPAGGRPTPAPQARGPPSQPRAPSHAPPLARSAPPHPQENVDPSIHCPFYDTKLKKLFGNPELYAKAFPHSWEAEQFRANQYDLSIFTPATLHPDYAPRTTTTPTYAQAAGSGPGKRTKKTKGASATEIARDGNIGLKTPSSLPLASRRFFTPRSNPAPHALAQRIAASFPDIAAATLTDSNCLLPKGFIAKVNNRGAFSLTGTNPDTPAESYAPYFNALTHRLNQSFPIGNNHWLTFTQGPISVQLAIHVIPTHVLPDDDEQLFTFIKNSILNGKAVEIGAARYLNQSQATRLTKQATSVVVSVTPTTFLSSSQPSSSSQSGSRSRKRRNISKTNTLRPMRLAHLAHITSIANQDATSI